MGISSAVAPRRGFQSDCVRLLHPFLDANLVVVQASLTSYYGEFAIIKSGVENRLPDAKELDRVAISQPIRNEELNSPSLAFSMSVSEM